MKKILLTAAAVFAISFANAQENIIKANKKFLLCYFNYSEYF